MVMKMVIVMVMVRGMVMVYHVDEDKKVSFSPFVRFFLRGDVDILENDFLVIFIIDIWIQILVNIIHPNFM